MEVMDVMDQNQKGMTCSGCGQPKIHRFHYLHNLSAPGNLPLPSRQSGYALLLVLFFGALLAIAVMAAAPVLVTEGRRQMEEEMIWRGHQYTRAIRTYYRKNGRFPQSIEDLSERRSGQIRYLRQPYKDPMNTADGSWRMIYVGPAGQLIGSVTRVPGTTLNLPPAGPGKAPGKAAPAPAPAAEPAPLDSGGQVFGGNLIGVGSKVARSSIKLYDGRDVYNEWEFIWDPSRDPITVGQPGAPVQPGKAPGLSPQPVRPPQ